MKLCPCFCTQPCTDVLTCIIASLPCQHFISDPLLYPAQSRCFDLHHSFITMPAFHLRSCNKNETNNSQHTHDCTRHHLGSNQPKKEKKKGSKHSSALICFSLQLLTTVHLGMCKTSHMVLKSQSIWVTLQPDPGTQRLMNIWYIFTVKCSNINKSQLKANGYLHHRSMGPLKKQ